MNGYYVGAAPPRPSMRDEDVWQYLLTCLKNLDAAGASAQQVVDILLQLAVNEAAHSGYYSHRQIQEGVASLLKNMPYEYRKTDTGRQAIPKRR